MGAYLITLAMGSQFVMYLAKMRENSKSGSPPIGVERFVFVLQDTVTLIAVLDISHKLEVQVLTRVLFALFFSVRTA
ncbi:(S)-ureidoglycine aminohydrolase [Olea europaea subsp. europaea]|uniref:(S)-ureidoglycine aminohydrolase n=1 Tax=Olea europaea subsp. europaea TaxID=158383 RepID=A0A8S0QEF9_OLEEU|nr:(S)-ureidoglycine aminohydrolase [Olea europaea subsp. europaea]